MTGPFGGWEPGAVVFDCDGLLADTEPCWTVAEAELFRRRGRPFGPDEKALLIGRSLERACEVLAREFAEPAPVSIGQELLGLVCEAVADVRPMPGAVPLVEHVAARMPVAIASNSPRSLLDVVLRTTGLASRVGHTVAADEVAGPKPAPDLYLESCRRLGVDPAAALAFEDSMTGVRSARAAGVRVVGVPTLVDGFDADWVVPSLDAPELLAWLGLDR